MNLGQKAWVEPMRKISGYIGDISLIYHVSGRVNTIFCEEKSEGRYFYKYRQNIGDISVQRYISEIFWKIGKNVDKCQNITDIPKKIRNKSVNWLSMTNVMLILSDKRKIDDISLKFCNISNRAYDESWHKVIGLSWFTKLLYCMSIGGFDL